jgi:hypothetical protein
MDKRITSFVGLDRGRSQITLPEAQMRIRQHLLLCALAR